ncbi:HemK methyltransferase family member 1 [Takifugu flavidus]|uniref:HemK methyltransferase family member 1 n=1 Tax=Takifugu flavidus TaxID=433684 RepID=A0A5C6N399_9TELE|nr:HemK methyltransferase family member 1 [Takifugu flavidus]
MWRKCLNPRSRWVHPKGLWTTFSVHRCSIPPLPAGRITTLEALDIWKRHFIVKGVSEPEHSSNYIIAHVLGAKTIESVEHDKLSQLLGQDKTGQIWQLCTKRLSRMPVQYVIEEWEFRDLTLKMRPPVFIPRPETEELVELVLSDLKTGTEVGADTQQTCLEVGCGSGAVSLSLLKGLPQFPAPQKLSGQTDLKYAVVRFRMAPFSLVVEAEHEATAPFYYQLQVFAVDQSQDAVDLTAENAVSRVYLEVEPRHPAMIQHWVEANEDELRYVETRHDITGRPRYCILQKEKSNKDLQPNMDRGAQILLHGL